MIAKIAVDKAAFGFDKLFDYAVPPYLEEKIRIGCRVMVPFGAGGQKRQGMVFGLSEKFEGDPKKLKSIPFLLDEEPVVSQELMELAQYLAVHTFCPLFEAVKAMLPPGLNFKPVFRYFVNCECSENEEEQRIINWLRKKKNGAEGANINKAFGFTDSAFIDSMAERGLLKREESTKRKIGDETTKMVRISDKQLGLMEQGNSLLKKTTPKQAEILDFLSEAGAACVKEISYFTAAGKAVVEGLEKKGVLEFFEQEAFRRPYKDGIRRMDPEEIVLSEEQKTAFEGIAKLCDSEKGCSALLFGVTGSGKTQVFIKLIQREIEKGHQVILMVPEISLTPQMMNKFFAYFGDSVAVMHSALSAGERIDEWKRIASGKARIIVGTRSAVFAPAKELGLIIMDEEQEQSYKSDRSPRFHAREAAAFRSRKLGIPLLLASATPSVETFYKAQKGKIALFEMTERYGGAELPESVIVDMKNEVLSGRTGVLSEALAEEIQFNLDNNQQSILLMNRRGYNTVARCAECGTVKACPRCNIPLIYHRANGRLMCHYCGHSEPATTKCDACGSEYVMYSGCGTQKVEDEIQAQFPEARILRMDLDTTMAKFSHDRHFADFAEGKYDIMVGTQMVAKGLDFPNVTLVGVLAADMTLYSGDYRSYERTFSLLTQVIGRCGRAKLSGRAYIQTYSPEHSVIERSCAQDYRMFYEDEIINRKVMLYPPFCSMGSVLFSGTSEKMTREAAAAFSKLLEEKVAKTEIPIRILGPTPSHVAKIADKWRWKLIIKYRPDNAFFETMGETLKEFSKNKEFVKIEVMADPYDIN
ncbi:MAG: primosomal protein N' [Oscillospiraceae bacterium]|nr:primosomal protein N' [Oscillospiraceae bacterium]